MLVAAASRSGYREQLGIDLPAEFGSPVQQHGHLRDEQAGQ